MVTFSKNNDIDLVFDNSDISVSQFMGQVYNKMTIGLLVTALSAYVIFNTMLVTNKIFFYGAIIAELGLVIFLSMRAMKMNKTLAWACFLVYSILNGVTLTPLLVIYTKTSIFLAFLVASLTFGSMSAYGYFTKKDLTGMGSFAIMGLFGVLIASVVNIFWANSTMSWILNYVAVIVFTLLTAYDTQRIKQMASELSYNNAMLDNAVIVGALTLYLDFINLFINLLKIMGNRE